MMKTNKASKVSFSAAKRNLLNTLILAVLVVPGVAMAADAPSVTSNVGLVSNYLYRGITQTGGKAAIQGGFDYAHGSGLYAGVWGSSISWLADGGYYNSSSLELDTYAGFKGGITEDATYDVGFLRYNYPGEYVAPQITANTNELYGAIGWKGLTAKYSRAMTNLFGVADSSGSSYLDLSGSYALEGPGVTLGVHYGKQSINGIANVGWGYSDYKLSASKDFSGYVVGLAYSSTNVDKALWGDKLGKSTVVLSMSHSM